MHNLANTGAQILTSLAWSDELLLVFSYKNQQRKNHYERNKKAVSFRNITTTTAVAMRMVVTHPSSVLSVPLPKRLESVLQIHFFLLHSIETFIHMKFCGVVKILYINWNKKKLFGNRRREIIFLNTGKRVNCTNNSSCSGIRYSIGTLSIPCRKASFETELSGSSKEMSGMNQIW